MADWDLSDLERKLRAEPGELLYLTKYCSLLNRASGLIVVDQYLTQHVNTHELPPLNKFKENFIFELLNLGLVPGAYTEATTNLDLDHCIEMTIEVLDEHSEAVSAAIGHDPHWIQKIDGNRVEHGYFSSEDTHEITQNIQRYRQHFLFSSHQHQLLRATMDQFSHNFSVNKKGIKKHAIFIPAWALEKLFSLEITRTSAGFSRSNRWYEATSKLTHFGHDWNKNQINKMRQALLGAIDDEISFKTLKFNGIFELDRYVDGYKVYRNEIQ